MLSLPTTARIFVAVEATDMRKSFDGLCGIVSSQLGEDPLSGRLYLFFNRKRDRLKILYWDGDGLAIWYRRLEQGTYQTLSYQPTDTTVQIKSDDLVMLLRGIDLRDVKRRKRFQWAG